MNKNRKLFVISHNGTYEVKYALEFHKINGKLLWFLDAFMIIKSDKDHYQNDTVKPIFLAH